MSEEKFGKILIVDDEKDILDIACEYFEYKGYEVITALNGLEAVKILEKEKIECCFTDINMPEMDGLELAEHIRKIDNTIPVVVMTGYPSLDNTIRTLKNGVVDFLIKPVQLSNMEICLQRVLRERELFAENILLKKEIEGKKRLAKLNKELQYKVDELKIFNRIMSDFSAISSTSDVFNKVVQTGIEITPADESRFYIINEAVKRPLEVAAIHAMESKQKTENETSLNTAGSRSSSAAQKSIESLIMNNVSDAVPLLISQNNQVEGLPTDIRSVMFVPLKIREKVFGVVTALINKGKNRFSEKDLYYMSFMTQNAAKAIENLALYENIYENLFATLYAFVTAIEARDPYTQQHSNRVTGIAISLGKGMGCTKEELDNLNFAGRLHDIGKIGVRDDILLKPGRLTKEEFTKIKEHPVIGANIVGELGLWDKEKHIIRWHHERFDGTGYPDGIKGNDIPLLARILSVADVYDALASDRAYRKKMEEDKILEIMSGGSGTQFDPEIIKVFFTLYEKGVL